MIELPAAAHEHEAVAAALDTQLDAMTDHLVSTATPLIEQIFGADAPEGWPGALLERLSRGRA